MIGNARSALSVQIWEIRLNLFQNFSRRFINLCLSLYSRFLTRCLLVNFALFGEARQLTSSLPLPAYPMPLLPPVGVDPPEVDSDRALIRLYGGESVPSDSGITGVAQNVFSIMYSPIPIRTP
jgi:hypothetical protein